MRLFLEEVFEQDENTAYVYLVLCKFDESGLWKKFEIKGFSIVGGFFLLTLVTQKSSDILYLLLEKLLDNNFGVSN